MQIANLYKKTYINSCNKISEERNNFIKKLNTIKGIKVYPSQANFLLCYLENYDSTELAIKLLNENIFIKDLKTKNSFKGLNYIRLAIRTNEDNEKLIYALKKYLD